MRMFSCGAASPSAGGPESSGVDKLGVDLGWQIQYHQVL